MSLLKVHIFISGRVQGVGFRFFACQQAENLDLSGWVRNLTDGRVEVVAVGPSSLIRRFVTDLNQGSALSRVDDVQIVSQLKVRRSANLAGFEVRTTR